MKERQKERYRQIYLIPYKYPIRRGRNVINSYKNHMKGQAARYQRVAFSDNCQIQNLGQ
jgi:hypothetical protein